MIQHFTIAHYKLDVGLDHHFPITDVGEVIDILCVQRRFNVGPNNRNNKMDYLLKVKGGFSS